MTKNLRRTLLVAALLICGTAAGAAVQVAPPGGNPKDDRQKALEKNKVNLADLEQQAARGQWSGKQNGVELAIKVKGVPNKEFTDIEVAWTLTYSGPRPPLIIVRPSLELTTGQSTVFLYAAPKGKNYAVLFAVASAREENGFVIDAYGEKKPLPDLPKVGTLPHPDQFKLRTRTKDWFVTVPAGKSATGVLTVSGAKLKHHLLTSYPGEFDPKEPPRLFVSLVHTPLDRGEDFNLDAWVGWLEVPANAVPALARW
jgi:hypothetical protein